MSNTDDAPEHIKPVHSIIEKQPVHVLVDNIPDTQKIYAKDAIDVNIINKNQILVGGKVEVSGTVAIENVPQVTISSGRVDASIVNTITQKPDIPFSVGQGICIYDIDCHQSLNIIGECSPNPGGVIRAIVGGWARVSINFRTTSGTHIQDFTRDVWVNLNSVKYVG